MTVKNPLNDAPQLQNLGIDHDMITRHAGDMNREFNRMYNEHVMNGGPSLQSEIMPPPAAKPVQQAPASPAPVSTAISQPAAQGADLNILQSVIQQTLTSSVQAQNTTLERFMKHMVDEQQKMVSHIQQLQEKLDSIRQAAGQQVSAPQVSQHTETNTPAETQQQAPAQQQSSGSQQITASHSDSDETAKLREQVSIENMFNFSGVGRGNAKRA